MKKKTQKGTVTKKKKSTGFMKKLQGALKKKQRPKKGTKVVKKSSPVKKKVVKKSPTPKKKKVASSQKLKRSSGKRRVSKTAVKKGTKKVTRKVVKRAPKKVVKKAAPKVKKALKNSKKVPSKKVMMPKKSVVVKKIVKKSPQAAVSEQMTEVSTDETVFFHEPVLLSEVCDLLELAKKRVVVDGTLGLGGHSAALLDVLPVAGKVIGFDADADHLAVAKKNLTAKGFKEKEGRVVFVHNNFVHLADELKKLKIRSVDGILLDLGIASPHVDRAERGFSFLREGPLDMRFGTNQERTAADVVNGYNEKELARIIFEYGEERQSRKIAREIVRRRKSRKFKTTTELAGFIEKLMGRRGRIHPATRVFQALRIEVNEELDSLQSVLKQAVEVLKKGGRVAVISYHSLEDRIVKNFFRDLARAQPARLKLVTKKPVAPTDEEVRNNPRSRSAKLRVAQKV